MTALAPSVFGRIVTGDDVEQWVLDCLKKWSGTYLAELERQHGMTAGGLARVHAWRTSQSYDKWPEDQLPCVIVRSVGIGEVPVMDGNGWYSARYVIQLDNVVSARTEDASHRLAMLYAAAHGALMKQRPSLDGKADGVRWLTDDYTQQAFESRRTLACSTVVLEVIVENVVSSRMGPTTPNEPLDPDTLPWPDDPDVQTHDETVVKLPLEGGTT